MIREEKFIKAPVHGTKDIHRLRRLRRLEQHRATLLCGKRGQVRALQGEATTP